MKYHDITKNDMLNGDGLRVILWVSGCTHNCIKCQNPITHDPNYGLEFDESAKDEIFKQLSEPYISGITLSGGDPLHPNNVKDISDLITEINDKFPTKTIWVYTGYTHQQLITQAQSNEYIKNILDRIDVLVDGPFIEKLCYIYHPEVDQKYWVGSSNQNVIKLKDKG